MKGPKSDRHQPSEMRRASSTDVAEHAGVSQSAVSRVFTPGASASPETRAKVLAAALELGYEPNALPRIVMGGPSRIVGLVAGNFDSPFMGSALESFGRCFRRAGTQVLLVHADRDDRLEDVVADVARYRVDGVVSALPARTPETVERLTALKTPVITLEPGLTGAAIGCVASDNEAGGRRAATLLQDWGAKCPAFLGIGETVAQQERAAGFLDAFREAGAPVPIIQRCDPGYEEGYAGLLGLFGTGARPDGLFCANDQVACGAIDALRDRLGIQTGRDFPIIGYDNIGVSGWAPYDLTTFDLDVDRLAETVRRALLAAPLTKITRVAPRLVERGSTRFPS